MRSSLSAEHSCTCYALLLGKLHQGTIERLSLPFLGLAQKDAKPFALSGQWLNPVHLALFLQEDMQ